uniref:Uncharacterized protein n=1 Tax=Oryzias latipes TaxID=8090 RepID=A0A3B3HAA1_ORYLA
KSEYRELLMTFMKIKGKTLQSSSLSMYYEKNETDGDGLRKNNFFVFCEHFICNKQSVKTELHWSSSSLFSPIASVFPLCPVLHIIYLYCVFI